MGKYQPERVWLFAYAMRMALTPVIILPIRYFVFHERVGWQAIFGTMLANTGVAVLFLA